MARFTQSVISDDVIQTDPDRVWDVLVDPDLLADLTPLVDAIRVEGDRWTWRLVKVSGVGMSAAPRFTTLMAIDGDGDGATGRRIEFEPARDVQERACAAGILTVEPREAGTFVCIDVTAEVELPLPGGMGRPVRQVMLRTMKAGGTRFARNMLAHLGNPPHRGLHVRAR